VASALGPPPAVTRSLLGLRANPDLYENYYTIPQICGISIQFAWYRAGRDHHDDTLSAIFALDVTFFTTRCHFFFGK
jgi:hypothetical protein